mmetsp:Transcript_7120/g.23503  ORF Transcript_7120/g.23503 Transcript_7120/m.23503 type:complete len:1021 (-) Transcript_7120:108-3170(-)
MMGTLAAPCGAVRARWSAVRGGSVERERRGRSRASARVRTVRVRGGERATRARAREEGLGGDGVDARASEGRATAKAARFGAIGAAVAVFVLLGAPKAASASGVRAKVREQGSSATASRDGGRANAVFEVADGDADVDGDDDDADGESKKTVKRQRRRRVTQKKQKMTLEDMQQQRDEEAASDGRGVKQTVKEVVAQEALERVQYKTGEHPESKNKVLRKLERMYADTSKDYMAYQEEQKNPIKAFFSKRGERFTRNVNLAYLRDPYSMMGTDRCPTETSYTAFHKLLDVGRVNRVVYQANETSVRYYIDDTKEVFRCNLPYDPMLYKKLLMERPGSLGFIEIEMEKYPAWLSMAVIAFNTFTPMILLFYAWLIYEDTYKDSSEDMFGNMTTRTYDATARQGMSLKDISGIDTVKAEMLELISYLKDFEKYNSMGARIPAGVLLCGPPGTGKTLLARCVAGEANVPFFSCAGTEFMEMFVGVGAARIRNLFTQAKKVAPCIIFIDEFDAVGTKRSETQSGQVYGNDEATATINQMLTEMDGFSTATGVMILAATNRPQVLDPALIRAGRFDRVIEMGLPNKKSREEILRLHCNKPHWQMSVDANLDYEYLSAQCAGFSGADIENLTKSAVMRVAQAERSVANTGDFLWCIDDIRRSQSFVRAGSGSGSLSRDTTLEDTLIDALSPYIRDNVATYYAAQTLVAMQMPAYDELSKVTVFIGGEPSGQISYVPDEVDSPAARTVRSQMYYESQLCVLVAGQMAERYLFGPEHVSSTGARDMQMATKLATDMVMRHGWSDLGPIALAAESTREEDYLRVGKEVQIDLLGQMSPELDLLVYNEVRKTLVKACQRAVMVLHESKNREMLFTLKEALLTVRDLTGRQLQNAFERAGINRKRTLEVWDVAWGDQDEVYWDDLMIAVWSNEPQSGKFWELVRDQWREISDAEGDAIPVPEWAEKYLTQMSDDERVGLAVTLPVEAAEKFLNQSGGVPANYASSRAEVDRVNAKLEAQRKAKIDEELSQA